MRLHLETHPATRLETSLRMHQGLHGFMQALYRKNLALRSSVGEKEG
jgi:hypothetical protein